MSRAKLRTDEQRIRDMWVDAVQLPPRPTLNLPPCSEPYTIPIVIPTQEETKMTLKQYTIWLTEDDVESIRNGDETIAYTAVSDVLPPPLPVIEIGTVYRYGEDEIGPSRTYRLVRVEDDEALLMRMSDSAGGQLGSTFIESYAKVAKHIMTGKAVIVDD